MGITILLIAIFIEVALAIYGIITKSNHAKERSILRIALFTGFSLLMVLSIIDWSFRYYGLTLLLLLFAIIGVITLSKKKEDRRAYSPVRISLKALAMIMLVFVLTLPAMIFPQIKPVVEATGKYEVLTKTDTYLDTSRVESYSDTGEYRKLNVQFWYPDTLDEKYPLIVFSHGGLGIKLSNESLYNELASHGYVVCSIDHTYQCFYTTDEGGDTTLIDWDYMQELLAEDPQSDIQQSFEYYQKWMKIRTDDINFIIDYIITEAENNHGNDEFKGVDTANIGVIGHSLGGAAALGIGRIRDDVKAVIALESPFMCDIEGIDGGQFIFTEQTYPVPVLNIYSDSAWGILERRPQYAANFAMLTDTDAMAANVYISGVGHLGLTDFALTSPFLTDLLNGQKATIKSEYGLERINKICLEFLNCFIKGEGEFKSSGSD
jgi:dienelactone hydrolase